MTLFDKPVEYWATMAGMVLYAATRDAENEPVLRKTVKLAASGLLAFGLSPSLAPWVYNSEIAAAIIVMAFGQIVLDVGIAILRDREFIKEMIRRRMGGKDE